MLSDEEKAIEMIEHIQECNTLIGYGVKDRTILAKALLNLIEKQSKEIEGLKVRNNKLAQCHFRYEEMTGIDLLLPDKLEYTSNDKIKAKIEEVQKRLEEETRTDFLIILRILENELQSLLEKE